MRIRLNIVALATIAALSAAGTHAQADDFANSSSFNSGWGMGSGGENAQATGDMRDANGNLTIVNGVIAGSAYSVQDNVHQSGNAQMNGTATAIGNNLNVTVNGSWNTVIVDSKQVNNGNQTATLNGDLKL